MLPEPVHETTQIPAAELATIEGESTGAVKLEGFSLHAGVVAQAHERDKLERLVRDITRIAISEKRLGQAGRDKRDDHPAIAKP